MEFFPSCGQTMLAERRKPSGECLTNVTKPEGSRPSDTKAKSKLSAIGRKPSGLVRKNEIKQKVEKQAVNLRKIAY